MLSLSNGNAVEQDLEVGQGVYRDADAADLLTELGIVGVVSALGGQVERHRQPRPTLIQQVAVAAIGFLGRAEAGVLPEGPQLSPVPGREVAAREGIRARGRRLSVYLRRAVHRRERDARWGLALVIHH